MSLKNREILKIKGTRREGTRREGTRRDETRGTGMGRDETGQDGIRRDKVNDLFLFLSVSLINICLSIY